MGAHHSYNKGWDAIVKCTISDVKKSIPHAQFTVQSSTVNRDRTWYKEKGIKIVSQFSLKTYLQSHRTADLILYLGGDMLSVSRVSRLFRKHEIAFGMFFQLFLFSYWRILRKNVMIYAHSLGPYKSFLLKCFSKFILTSAKVITVRGDLSGKNLDDIGIHKYYVTGDPAFLLETTKEETVKAILLREGIKLPLKRPMIGVSVSQNLKLNKSGYETFINIFSKVLERSIDKFDVDILLIPHSIGKSQNEDDRVISISLINCINSQYKSRTKMLNGDYAAEELKGIIAFCEAFIGCRMHANIAALSTCTPVIAVAHGQKYFEIMKMCGMEEYTCDVSEITFNEFSQKIERLWTERKSIRQLLSQKIKEIRKLAKLNAMLVKEC